MPTYPAAAAATGSTVTLPAVVGSADDRFTTSGLLGPNVFAEFNYDTVADFVAEDGDATIVNGARWTTASDGSSVSTIEHDSTDTNWLNGTYTSPARLWPVGRGGFVEFHIATKDEANAGDIWGGLLARSGANNAVFVGYALGAGGAAAPSYGGNEGPNTAISGATINTAECDTGIWLRLDIDATSGGYRLQSVLGASASRPAETDYSTAKTSASYFAGLSDIELGFYSIQNGDVGSDDEWRIRKLRIGRVAAVTIS